MRRTPRRQRRARRRPGASDGVEAVCGEQRPGGRDLSGRGRGGAGEREVRPRASYLATPSLWTGDEDEPHPDVLAEVGEPPREVQGRLQLPPGDPVVELAIPGLDVQQDEVDVGQQGVGGAGAGEAGGVQRGVQAEFVPEPVEQLAREHGLEQRLATADGGAAAGRPDEGGVLPRLGNHLGNHLVGRSTPYRAPRR